MGGILCGISFLQHGRSAESEMTTAKKRATDKEMLLSLSVDDETRKERRQEQEILHKSNSGR
jgi:hypothetical protein